MNNLEQRLAALSPEQRALLAQRLKERETPKAPATPAAPPIAPADRTGLLPLSFAQQRLWFLDQMDPNSSLYTIVVAYELKGQLDQRAFIQALTALVERHEALRTTIDSINGVASQHIAPSIDLPLEIHDLSGLEPAAAQAIGERMAQHTFNLARGPLFQVALCRLDASRHQFMLAVHHIVFDEWSTGVLLRELGTLYDSYAREQTPGLAPLEVQYADVAAWQRQWLQGAPLEQQLEYWKHQLAGPPPVLNLPTDYPHPPIQTFNTGRVQRTLSPKLTQGIAELAQREGMTPYMVLLAGYQLLLSRYSGQREFLVGSPIAGRTRPELEPLIGCFINTLVLRADLRDRPSGRALLRRVRETCLEAYAHQDLPFELLVDAIQPERDLSRTALFQVLFDFHNAASTDLHIAGLEAVPLPLGQASARFDLALVMGAVGQTLAAEVVFNSDLFAAATIERLLGHYELLLEQLVATPDAPALTLPLLTAAEWDELVVARNATDCQYALDRPLHAWIEDQAARTPAAVAARSGSATMTYAALNAEANRLARHLRTLGVRPGERVGICLERSPAMLVGLLAILKAGGAFVPLDPAFPSDRMAYILDDGAVWLVLSETHLAGRLPQRNQTVLCLDGDVAQWAGQSTANLDIQVTGADLAYLIYTSGSTGRPKGVLIPHSGIVNYLIWGIDAYGAASGKGAPVHASIAADAIFPSLFMPLYVGTTVVFFPGEGALNALSSAIQHEGPWSMIKITPSQLEVLTHELPPEPTGAEHWVRTLVIGAEALRGEVLNYWQSHAPATVLLNEYGPTETVVGCSIYQVPTGRRITGAVPIGLPIANLTFYVLDSAMQPVPVGVSGELYIGGVGVAWGYHNRQALTAEKFVPDPFSVQPGARLYRTGDVVRWLADRASNIEFLGRDDDQVKVRGYRVELGEVEAVLDHHEAVWEVVVLARDIGGARRLVAYVVPEPQAELTAAMLREYLLARLPEYMVPSIFMFMPALPLAPHGKIDRQALPLPDSERPEEIGAAVAPRTPLEATLAGIWQEVLGLSTVGIYDNFFELGGDSILSIQIIARSNAAGWRLTPRQMFLHQTIAEITEVAEPIAAAADQGPVLGPAPLTPIQWRFFEQDLANHNLYNQTVFLEARERLQSDQLKQAVGAMIAHHDAFRLRFTPAADRWHQASIAPEERIPYTQIDLAALPLKEQDAAIEAAATALHLQIDLARGPLINVALFERGPAPQLLLIIVHHMVIDGISWRLVLEDLAALYVQQRAGQPMAMPAKSASYQLWSQRLEEYATAPALTAELAYWMAQKPVQPPHMPIDRQGGANTESAAARIRLALGAEDTRALLQNVPAAYRTQINDVLLTALAQAYRQWSGQALYVDLEGHGREDVFDGLDVSRTVGWFTSVFPVALNLPATLDVGAALKQTKEHLRTVPQRGIGYGVLHYLSPDPAARASLAGGAQPELSFNYLGQFTQANQASAAWQPVARPAGRERHPEARRRYLIEIDAGIENDQLEVTLTYSTARHDAETIQRFGDQFLARLRAIIEHCAALDAGGCTPSDFPLARITQRQLDALVHNGRMIADIYPLAPLQQGMLFQSLYNPGIGVYIEQVCWQVRGPLDSAAFERAWQAIVDQYPILRSSFHWQQLDSPLQVVRHQAKMPFERHDWQQLDPSDRAAELEAFMQADRRRGFDLSAAPLMRVNLIQLAADTAYLVWSFHHIVLDGWSVSMVLNILLNTYESFKAGVMPQIERSRPYRDYIAWIGQQDLVAAEHFWQSQLKGVTAPTPLAFERPNGSPPVYAEQEIKLAESTTSALRTLAQARHLTFNTLLQGAWSLLLSHYSGQDDVLFGAVVSGRPPTLAGIEKMVGLFINTLPVRTSVGGDQPLAAWLEALQQRQADLRQYEHVPLVQIQGWSAVPRGKLLFENILIFENYPIEERSDPDNELEFTNLRFDSNPDYPLSMIANPGPELQLRIWYNASRFPGENIALVLADIVTLLNRMAAAADRPLGSYVRELPSAETLGVHRHPTAMPQPAVDPAASHSAQSMIHAWNQTAEAFPPAACLHTLVAEQALRTPAATAVTHTGYALSYSQLDQQANQLANQLQALGVGPDTLVGVCAQRSPAMVVGMLAILKAGGAYVPLDPAYPAARLRLMADDAGLRIVLADSPASEFSLADGRELVALDPWGRSESPQTSQPPASRVTPDHLAYVIYTSGSTGRPKGVMVSHRAIYNTLRNRQARYPLTAADHVLQTISASFDPSIWDIFGTLMAGANLVTSLPTKFEGVAPLTELIARHAITVCSLGPAWIHMVLQEPDVSAYTSLRRVFCGGEALGFDLQERFFERLGAELHNLYGPTEAAIEATVWDCQPGEGQPRIPIGRPIANVEIYLLDAQGQLAAVGAAGEIYIGGAGLARGYLAHPDLTAERFIPHPWSQRPGARLYRTGDLARYRPDGAIEYLGRLDDQIKLRGFRVELGEIESALQNNPQVREAVAAVRADDPANQQLVAYIVPWEPGSFNASALSQQLKALLPQHMVPQAFVTLDRLPLTPNGKIDRRALPAPGADRLLSNAAYVAPLTLDEELLAEIWAAVLGAPLVGREDNFFALGGHSLTSIQVIARIRELFQVELPFQTLFQSPTLAGLAAEIAQLRRTAQRLSIPPLQRLAAENRHSHPLPVSFGQQRLWFIDQLTGSATYNIPLAQHLDGRLDARALQRGLNALVARHEILRTTFAMIDGQPMQIVAAELAINLPIHDLQALPADERLERARLLAVQEAQRPFDLAVGPLIRGELLRLGPDEHIFLLTMHHIVSDGWSMGILLRELAALYAGFCTAGDDGQADRAATLPALPIQYADYAVWQRQWLNGASRERQLDYWREILRGMPTVLDLPTDHPRPPVQSLRGATYAVNFPAALLGDLQQFSRQEGVTLFMTLLTAFNIVLARYTGQTDIVVGTPAAGRSHAELEPLIGFFINTLVLRTRFSATMTGREVLARVRETSLGALGHQETPFEHIVELVQPERDTSRNPLFQVALLFHQADDPGALPGLRQRPLAIERQSAKIDLTLEITQSGSELGAVLEYAQDLFDEETVARFAGHYQQLLAALIANPDQMVATLPLLDASELADLRSWNDTAVPAPPTRLPDLISAQALRTPAAPAIVQGTWSLTYAELDGQANQLATTLREQGVGPDTLVGLCAERSPALVVGLLAIMKAGGAYVPLDPAYPAERLRFMVADAGITLLLAAGAPGAALRDLVPGTDLELIPLDGWGMAGAPEAAAPPASGATPDHLAYVIYTSGSTGRPKGVMVSHRGLRNMAQAQASAFGIDQRTRMLQFASLNFDASIFEITMALWAGATLCLAPAGPALLGADLADWLRDQAISIVTLPPSVLATLPEAELADLKVITVAGEACSANLVSRWAPNRRFFNLYGPTEATVWTTIEECQPTGAPPTIGRPIANTEVYLLDAGLQPVPVGVAGELHIGGIGLARGYLGRADLTAERFIPHPWAAPGARLYKSGDLARYRSDGSLEYLGRIDTQVKVRGFRIEAGEVESLLLTHPGVSEALVLAHDDESGNKRLLGYVVVPSGAAPTTSELRDLLKERLPEYMVPSAFIILEALPLTPNGKVDRRLLPTPDSLRPDLAGDFIAPVSDVEETIAAAWRQVLGLERIGVHDNFFDLGGHSLLVVQAHKELSARLPQPIALIEMFRRPTISALAAYFAQDDSQRNAFDPAYQPEDRARKQLQARQRRSQARKDKGTA